jgi:hypothetical protein
VKRTHKSKLFSDQTYHLLIVDVDHKLVYDSEVKEKEFKKITGKEIKLEGDVEDICKSVSKHSVHLMIVSKTIEKVIKNEKKEEI